MDVLISGNHSLRPAGRSGIDKPKQKHGHHQVEQGQGEDRGASLPFTIHFLYMPANS